MDCDDRRIPRQSIEAEMSVLGAIFVDNDALAAAHEVISADDLHRQSHRLIFKAMTSLDDKGEPIDLITVTEELRQRGELEEVGGGAFLYTLADYVPMAANIAHYCRIVKQKAMERRLISNCQEAANIIHSGGEMAQAIAKLEDVVYPLESQKEGKPIAMDISLRESIKRIEEKYEAKGQLQGISYGISALDAVTSGMHPGELIVVAGRPSMGKSAFAGNIAANVCQDGGAALVFTLEMNRLDVVDRMYAGCHVKYQNIRSGRLGENDWPKLTNATGKMHNWRMFIDDTPAISLREVRSRSRGLVKEDLKLIVIDYLQLMALSDPRMNRVQGIGEISRGLKQLARELSVPVMALSQLNRGVDNRNDKRPAMSDLRDSGEIEQDADVILFPYRPAAYCEKCRDKIDDGEHDTKTHQGKAEIIIEKQRAGERNLSIPVVWMGEYQRFEEYDPCPY